MSWVSRGKQIADSLTNKDLFKILRYLLGPKRLAQKACTDIG